MACGVALKRSLDFDPLHNVNPSVSCDESIVTPSAKRRRYSIPQRCRSITSVTSTPPSVSPSVWRRYVPSNNAALSEESVNQSPIALASKTGSFSSEQIVKHIYQEYKKMKKRKQLVTAKSQVAIDEQISMDAIAPLHQSHGAHSSYSQLPLIHLDPKSNSNVILPGKQNSDTPLLSIRQVGLICERLLQEQEERLRTEYEKALVNRLSEQYDAFVKFSHDQLRQQMHNRPASYVS